MSDAGRKDITTQVAEKVTPQEHKTPAQKVKETVTGVTDKVAAAVTPSSEKSATQEVADKVRAP
jgi:hypothetical protein